MAIVLTCDNRGPTGSCDTCGVGSDDHCKRHPMNPTNERNVPCKWCGQKTNMLGTRECDNCHEMASRMERNPKLAQSIMDKLMPATGKCVCTGIMVQFKGFNTYAHADLFDMGTHWVIQHARWMWGSFDKSLKSITVSEPSLERNDVIFAPKSVCELSQAALDYMQEMWGSNGN